MNFTSPETRMIVLPDTEDRMIVSSFLWTKHRTGRTDRRTEMSWLLQRYALRAMRTRCKTYKTSSIRAKIHLETNLTQQPSQLTYWFPDLLGIIDDADSLVERQVVSAPIVDPCTNYQLMELVDRGLRHPNVTVSLDRANICDYYFDEGFLLWCVFKIFKQQTVA